MSMIKGTLTCMKGHIGNSVAVDSIMGYTPVNGSRGIGHIRQVNTLWFAQTLQETTHNETTSRANTKC